MKEAAFLATIAFGIATLSALLALAIYFDDRASAKIICLAFGAGYFCQFFVNIQVEYPDERWARLTSVSFQGASVGLSVVALIRLIW